MNQMVRLWVHGPASSNSFIISIHVIPSLENRILTSPSLLLPPDVSVLASRLCQLALCSNLPATGLVAERHATTAMTTKCKETTTILRHKCKLLMELIFQIDDREQLCLKDRRKGVRTPTMCCLCAILSSLGPKGEKYVCDFINSKCWQLYHCLAPCLVSFTERKERTFGL